MPVEIQSSDGLMGFKQFNLMICSSSFSGHKCGTLSVCNYQVLFVFAANPLFMWVFPKIRVPQNGWFIMENPIKTDDLGGTPIFGNTHVYIIYTHIFEISIF